MEDIATKKLLRIELVQEPLIRSNVPFQPLGNKTMHHMSHKYQDCYPLFSDSEVLLALEEAGCGLHQSSVEDKLEVSRAGLVPVVARKEINALVVAQVLEYRTCLSRS